MSIHVVWVRSDLHLEDHAPLSAASALAPLVCLHAVTEQTDHAALAAYDAALLALGGLLVVREGRVEAALQALQARWPLQALWSHDTADVRDDGVQRWCAANTVPWKRLALRRGLPAPRAVQSPSNIQPARCP